VAAQAMLQISAEIFQGAGRKISGINQKENGWFRPLLAGK